MAKKLNSPPTFIDLFAGCGGLSLGLMMAGWQGLFAIEKSPMAFETLKHNLTGHEDQYNFYWPRWLPVEAFDIQFVLENYRKKLFEIEQLDLLAGGPPCQGFSIAGRRKIDDERNFLIRHYLKFVEIAKPKIILVENVRTFATTFKKTERGTKGQVIENGLNANLALQDNLVNLNYTPFVKYPVIAKNYGVPQLRPRYYLIAVRNDLIKKDLFINPFTMLDDSRETFLKEHGLSLNPITLEEAVSDLEMRHGYITCIESGMDGFKQGTYGSIASPYQNLLRTQRSGAPILAGTVADSHRFPNHLPSTIERFQHIISNYRPGVQLSLEERELLGIHKHRITPLAANQACHTITSLPDDLIHYAEPRIPTVREYARIQSFPDWFQFKAKYTSGGYLRKIDVPRYTQVANAVPPLLAEAIGEALYTLLKRLNVRN